MSKSFQVLTTEDHAKIVNWAKMGVGCGEIANKLGNKVSKQRIAQICAKRGLDPMSIKREIKELERQDRMRRLYGSFWHNGQLIADKKTISAAKKKFRYKKNNSVHAFTVEFSDIEWPTHCPVLGIELDYHSKHRQENSVTFDRIDNTKPYEPGNVVIMSWRANRIKNDGTAEEHRLISNYMLHKGVK